MTQSQPNSTPLDSSSTNHRNRPRSRRRKGTRRKQRLISRRTAPRTRLPTTRRLHDTRTSARVRHGALDDAVERDTCLGTDLATVWPVSFGDCDAGDGLGRYGGEGGGCGFRRRRCGAREEVGFVGGAAAAMARGCQ